MKSCLVSFLAVVADGYDAGLGYGEVFFAERERLASSPTFANASRRDAIED
jgi:hypothetical protein